MNNTHLLLFITASFLLSGTIHAQDAQFPTEDARWCYTYHGDMGAYLGTRCFSPLGYDSVGNQHYVRTEYNTNPYGRSDSESILYRVDGERVYVLPKDSTQELLTYDFSLVPGDSFVVKWGTGVQPNTVVIVQDTQHITTDDGVKRRVIELTGKNSSAIARWIEGIGSDWMYMLPSYQISVSGWIALGCFGENGQHVYTHSWIGDCMTVSIENGLDKITMYPNPTRDHFYIENPSATHHTIQVLDLHGKQLLQQQLTTGSNHITLPSGTPAGVYAVWMTNQKGEHAVQKLVVE